MSERLKKLPSQQRSYRVKYWNSWSKAIKPGFPGGERVSCCVHPTVSMHRPHTKKQSSLMLLLLINIFAWVSGHSVWDSGPNHQDLLKETIHSLFCGDCITPKSIGILKNDIQAYNGSKESLISDKMNINKLLKKPHTVRLKSTIKILMFNMNWNCRGCLWTQNNVGSLLFKSWNA